MYSGDVIREGHRREDVRICLNMTGWKGVIGPSATGA